MATLGKRILAIALALVMCFNALQLSSLAADVNQVMDGYYILNENDTVNGKTDAAEREQSGFTVSKTIEQTGVNQFDVTLKVITQQTVTTDASAIQLVIDRSNSMNYCAACGDSDRDDCGCNAGSRMAAVRSAIAGEDGFLDQLVAGNKGKLYISIVVFSGSNSSSVKDAMTVLGWTELNAGTKAAIANVVNGISYNGGTNLQAGLTLAANRLQMSDIAQCSTKYTVLLTDGAPTYYMGSTDSNTSEINSTAGSGSAASQNTINGGITAANAVKSHSTLYTICYGVSDEYLLEGEQTNICAHCDEDRDDHYELCVNCKQERSEHTRYGMSRYCSNGYGQKYRSGYFCDEEGKTRFESAVSGALTVGQYLNGSIASSASTAYNAADMEDVYNAFSNIADSAISGMTGSGTTVTDPMGKFIVLGDVSGSGVNANSSALTWKLDPANAEKTVSGNVTTYTYTLTYPITLDTSAQGFQSGKYYPANGYTYLSAVVDGETVKIPFNVPGVCGEVPQYNWSIEYYLENAEGTYDLAEQKDMGAVDLWTSVNAPEGYASKYSGSHYVFDHGNPTMQITAGENVMQLFYNRDMAKVTVNHFYKTTVINPDGTVTEGVYPEAPQITDVASKWIGTSFSAQQQNTYGGAVYSLDTVVPGTEITVSANENENVISFYYSREDDQRAATSAEVKHTYKTYGYVLQDGRYVLVETASATLSAESAANLKATTTYTVQSTSPLAGYEDYVLVPEEGDYAALQQNGMTFVLADNPEANVRTLVFKKIVDNRVPVQVTVNHYYTKSVTSVQDGNVVTVISPDNELGKTEPFSGYYVGESFAATEFNTYGADTYVSDAGNAAKCAQIVLQGDTTIDLYYSLTIVPPAVSVTVNHYWRTFTDVTVEKTDAETGEVIGTEIVPQVTEDYKIEGIVVSDLLEGQNFTAALESIEGGYTFNETESNRTITVYNGAVINLYYDRSATEDVRTDATIDVQHKYTTYLTTVVGGAVETLTLNDGTVSESYPAMKAGDSFTAVAQPTYNDAAYTQVTDAAALSVILQPGTNGTIVIEYVREISDLVPVTYDVNYVYKTYTMTVNEEGKAGYWNEPAVDSSAVAGTAGYVGEQVVLSAGEREGFAPLAGNPATEQILASEGNTWTFVYERYIPLGMGSVTVNHHYETTTIAENGTATVSTEDVLGTAVPMYLGESVLAENLPGTFQLVSAAVDGNAAAAEDVTVIISGDNVVDFYYKKTVDNSRMVDYTVSHIYNLYTYNGQLVSSQSADAITGSGFVTTQVTAVPSPAGYALASASYNGAALAEPYTISLADGKNEIVFVYIKYLPREEVDVTVIHNYYEDAASVGGEAVEVYQEVISGISEDTDYTAQLRDKEGFEFHSAVPGSMTITAVKGGENVIVLNYTRIIVEEPPVVIPPVEEPPAVEPPVEEPPVEEPPVVDIPVIEIPDEEVPLAPAPEADEPLVELPDEEVPLAEVPKTGDATVLYAVLTTLSGAGLAALGLKKKEENEE